MFEAIIFTTTIGSLWTMCAVGMVLTFYNDQEVTMYKKRKIIKEPMVINFENAPEDITKELAKTLKELQEDYDLETEEVEKTVNKGHFKKLIRKYFRGQFEDYEEKKFTKFNVARHLDYIISFNRLPQKE